MGKENRRQKRIDLNIDVNVAHESKLQKVYSKNLSKGGIYLSADDMIPVGSKVNLTFFIKELDREFKIRAEVVHHHKYDNFTDEGTMEVSYGMGLRFVEISRDDQNIIDKFIIGKELKKGA